MSSCRRIKTLPNAGSGDLISQLPVEVKERILELLPTRVAAKTALLSTQWREAWLGHGHLKFDFNFIGSGNTITNILLHRAGPVKKFLLYMYYFMPRHNDLDNWFLYLSRNGIEELDISRLDWNNKYKLPSCIVSCPTIKLLNIYGGFIFCFPVNACCIFPGITSLVLQSVEFNDNVNGTVYSIPNLETLAFKDCKGIGNFEISAPKLKILSASGYSYAVDSRWFMRHLTAINTLYLSVALLTACSSCNINAASRLLEDPVSCMISQDLKMLNTIKIESFSGSTPEMLFMKMLLSKSPALKKLVIQESHEIDASMAVKILRELLCFPRASPKAQLVCTEYKNMCRLVDCPRF